MVCDVLYVISLGSQAEEVVVQAWAIRNRHDKQGHSKTLRVKESSQEGRGRCDMFYVFSLGFQVEGIVVKLWALRNRCYKQGY